MDDRDGIVPIIDISRSIYLYKWAEYDQNDTDLYKWTEFDQNVIRVRQV